MSKQPFAGQNRPGHAEFSKVIKEMQHRHQLWRLFSDFCEMAAMALANCIPEIKASPAGIAREERYTKIAARYDAEELTAFARLLAITTEGLDCDGQPDADFLGEVFMGLELGSHWHGQFFTPMCVARLMGEMNCPTADDPTIARRGYIKVLEPACGAGGMILAFAGAMRARGFQSATADPRNRRGRRSHGRRRRSEPRRPATSTAHALLTTWCEFTPVTDFRQRRHRAGRRRHT